VRRRGCSVPPTSDTLSRRCDRIHHGFCGATACTRPERVAEIAAEFVRLKVDVIVTNGPAVATLKQASGAGARHMQRRCTNLSY
jgi:hypothetical protein